MLSTEWMVEQAQKYDRRARETSGRMSMEWRKAAFHSRKNARELEDDE
ncbi:hypothetical protein [Halomarina rubra]|uniref:Uncharacterized protein n=1 Tax=Halomarina rubra TaxID=2071873 RepID=A0ABD6B1R7_9EURY|nr:hypothetical protein [Halomarina rubra]